MIRITALLLLLVPCAILAQEPGEFVWETEASSKVWTLTPASDSIMIACLEDSLSGINVETGETVWTVPVKDEE